MAHIWGGSPDRTPLMTRSTATKHWPWLVLLLFILLIGGGAWRHFSSAPEGRASVRRTAAPAATAPSPAPKSKTPALAASREKKPKVHRTGSKARIRVLPGETAVLSYHEIKPGTLGLTMVTPVWLESGSVSLQLRTYEVADTEGLREEAQDILPDLFEMESSGVITQARMDELLRFMVDDSEAKTVGFPRISTKPGQECSVQTGVNEPGGRFIGVTYALRVDSITDSDGFDLSVDFERSGARTED